MLFKYIYILCALITSSGIYAQFTVKGTVLFEGDDKTAGGGDRLCRVLFSGIRQEMPIFIPQTD